ncbi:MAG: N-terminal phage integrase SAM-like domain-containing protein [Synergistales bacterium]|nr:N-terminal phage integrase SAM-like domain-containing protein [Synergistales bacterium]MDY6404340.1 N-terminal phage integrase SAM-like domain-containing protein [Synergistales bacterium]MDY6413900.1 N-terminal phage integrase SAM-like domain-containing protein [Synergistales bacterium]MDY6422271.1 N-terminal phage integrase SAM-like domain-containing protein [Synergistales bacterium]MDY6429350.1 N-terminal phage integrase SAM-like domain-containing protein [Synergistales bacterium]
MPRKGENIFKRKDGRWEGRYIKGHDGKKAVYGYVFGKSYSEVKQKKAEAVSQLEIGQSRLKTQKLAKSPNFENIAHQWLEEFKPIRKKSTIVKYMSQLKNYIIPAFGKFNLSDIGNEDIISFANKLLTEGRNG